MICYEEVGDVTPAMWDFLMHRGGRMSAVPSVVFTGPDKALLDRTARAAEAAAKAIGWESIVDPRRRKAAKLEFDRLKRDAHDLRALGVRLTKVAKSLHIPPKPAVLLATAPFGGTDQRGRIGDRRLVSRVLEHDETDRRLSTADRRSS